MGFLWFGLGLVVGAGVMLFVFNNNKKKMSALAEGLERELQKAKAKISDLEKKEDQ